MDKQRIDTLLLERGFAESRAKAQALVLAGQVRVDGQVVAKASQMVAPEAAVALAEKTRFASRGGDKLDHALNFFGVNVAGKICLDTGASTGGFTDCLLQRGAAKVFAVDVGKGQLHWKLRNDARIVIMDKTNARYLTAEQLAEKPQLAALDVSFISLTKVLPAVINIVASGGMIVALVKPQFEAERHEIKRGVVRSAEARLRALEKIRQFGAEKMHLTFKGACESPLKGPAGNIEYFICWTKTPETQRAIK
ncbi:MAG: TlyA family RNA methyltransferase [Kiritimatiellae bacterium]|nr:TlyA family RNA methyltransferase [Kiritimatiellia bacterium]